MRITATDIEGPLIIEPKVFEDARGYFFESYQSDRYKSHGISPVFVQDNEAFSLRGALRGLHYQVPPFAQAKLVRVVHGEVWDVVIDIRPGSKTFGSYTGVYLSAENKKQFFVPVGFAHGYVTLSDQAIFCYKCDQYYQRDHEGGIQWDDPDIGIEWPFAREDLIISDKDSDLPSFREHRIFTES